MVADILGVKNPVINHEDWMVGDIKVFNIDNTKIKKDLGMEFLTDFHKGLEMTVDWARGYFEKKQG